MEIEDRGMGVSSPVPHLDGAAGSPARLPSIVCRRRESKKKKIRMILPPLVGIYTTKAPCVRVVACSSHGPASARPNRRKGAAYLSL